jgi:hypothetical protein
VATLRQNLHQFHAVENTWIAASAKAIVEDGPQNVPIEGALTKKSLRATVKEATA